MPKVGHSTSMNQKTPIIADTFSTNIEFSTVNDKTPIPNLQKISKVSYNNFTQRFQSYNQRNNTGLEVLLKTYFGRDYCGYILGTCEYSSEDCLQLGITFSCPIYVLLKDRLSDPQPKTKKYFIGYIPLISKNGCFIFNGIENTIVNQLIRDSGLYINYTHNPQVANSIKIRGYGGKSLQFDIFHSSFIGRRRNIRTSFKKKDVGSHDNLFNYLDHHTISFQDVAEALTYTTELYRYSPKGWYLVYDWSSIVNSRYVKKRDTVITRSMNIRSVYGDSYTRNEYHTVLNTQIEKLFIDNLMISLNNREYILIDILDESRKSIFQVENITGIDARLLVELLKYIGKKVEDIHSMEDLLKTRLLKYNLLPVFIIRNEKGPYYASLISNLLILKRKKALIDIKSSKQSLEYLSQENIHTPFNDFKIDLMGRLRLNTLLGRIGIKSSYLRYDDLVPLIRYLLQLRRKLIHRGMLEEQDLYNRRFNSIGVSIFGYLEVLIQDAIKKQSNLLYKKSIDASSKIKARVLGCQKVFEFLLRFIGRSSLCQYTEQGNSLSYLTHSRKVSLMGPGGLKNENVSLDMRDVHISNYGRLCPIETPEGKSVGVVTTLSVFTRVNKYNQIETPYLKVTSGRVTGVIHYLSLPEERVRYIALATDKCYKDGSFIENLSVYSRYNYKTAYSNAHDISYIELSPKQLTSLSSSLIPFLEHNDAIRALMGANMQRQAVPLDYLDMPLVATGMESLIARDLGSSSKMALSSTGLMYVDNRYSMQISEKSFYDLKILSYPYIQYTGTNQKTLQNQKAIKKFDKKGHLHSGYAIENGVLSLGNTLLVGYTSMIGHTFEDSIVISERILRDRYLQSTHIEIYRTTETNESDSYEVIRKIEGFTNIDKDGVIFLGTSISKDSVLVCKEKRQLLNYKKDKLVVYDKSVHYKNKKDAVVIRIDKFFETYTNSSYLENKENPVIRLYNSIKTTTMNSLLNRYRYLEYCTRRDDLFFLSSKKLTNDSELSAYLPKVLWMSFIGGIIGPLQRSKKDKSLSLTWMKKIYIILKMFKNISTISSPDAFQHILSSIYDKYPFDTIEKSITSKRSIQIYAKRSYFYSMTRVRQPDNVIKYLDQYHVEMSILEYYLSYIIYHHIKNLYSLNQYNKYPSNIRRGPIGYLNTKHFKHRRQHLLKMVKVTVATKHSIQVGDKLTGRYGNKGVISRILSIEDMPYLTNGTPIDIILSPLGVSSRMNIGQLFESHLGMASIELSNKIHNILSSTHNIGYLYIKQLLHNLYRNKKEYLQLQNMDKVQLLQLYQKLSHGMRISTPIFDSISNQGIDSFIRKSGLTYLGKYKVFDGITGSQLDNNITVGYLYIMKLNHLIDHKMHGRSVGPYNVITQQASKGKSRNGGQRLGEMEVWALQAYGVAYTLQEMLTFKSDSTVARTNFLQNFIKGKSYKIDIPRTFKLLRDELRVLGMELSFFVKKYKKK